MHSLFTFLMNSVQADFIMETLRAATDAQILAGKHKLMDSHEIPTNHQVYLILFAGGGKRGGMHPSPFSIVLW